ncbi:DUF4145 domain-containing protein [Fibrella forsythiae]|uniref:DUF4145 domain-containing protein n=1 Tax=Fibrella forsythiae TaxID=2817061 RepID=A0ABS3JBA8_9BACT|nr:DUF4145 domain-containing protein [Fibrella forsythiae]MBO0947268.1 DUF4145 domain-containing protein [Fibrella forsythiae]
MTISYRNTSQAECNLSVEAEGFNSSIIVIGGKPEPTYISISGLYQKKAAIVKWIVCINDECKKASLSVALHTYYDNMSKNVYSEPLMSWQLIPASSAKSFPEYIPLPIRQDYEEACLILELSPKASATLSRRCLQGMIRDFFNVTGEKTLFNEIKAIENKVDPITWQAIHAVRQIGNIGAHMENDINLIVDVDPNEAKVLIALNEMLLKEWYIHRYERTKRLESIIGINAEKQDERRKSE